jgi:beta-phosphoglucomutase-like phosphatase (HAD superfamily)
MSNETPHTSNSSRGDASLARTDFAGKSRAVVVSWHGVLFDRGRRAINAAVGQTFARWSVTISEPALIATRGPTGRPHIERLFALPEVSEAFRAKHGHWVTSDEVDAMVADLEVRLVEAAQEARTPNADACDALRRLHAHGIQTAVICCTPRRLLQPQLDALAAAEVPLDVIVTADEACAPVPAPWGLFETLRQLGLERASDLALIDDCEDGARAARNAGVRMVALSTPGAPPITADAVIERLEDVS